MNFRPAALLALLLALPPLPPAAAEQPSTPEPPTAPPPEQVAPAQPAWLPRAGARLALLDKISAQVTDVTIKVGQSIVFGSLTIAVRACDIRPPDVPQDATVLLDITDANPGMPGFHGWMLASAPGVSMLEHPVYDVRLLSCTD